MTAEEKLKQAKAALEKIIETAKRDPKVDPEKLRQIAGEALEKLSRS